MEKNLPFFIFILNLKYKKWVDQTELISSLAKPLEGMGEAVVKYVSTLYTLVISTYMSLLHLAEDDNFATNSGRGPWNQKKYGLKIKHMNVNP